MSSVEQPWRHVHFVGTVPEKDSAAAIDLMLEEAGPHLKTIPDGETGRPDYVTDLVIGLRHHPAVRHVLPGMLPGRLRNFFDLPVYTLNDAEALTPESLELGYADEALSSWPVFLERKAAAVEAGQASPDLRFQVGVPGDLQLPFMAFKAAGFDETHQRPFREATAEEIRRIHAGTHGQAVIQLEVPTETVLTAYTPRAARAAVADRFARRIAALVRATPDDVTYGIHACNIDMNKKSLLPAVSTHATMTLADAIVRNWPDDRAPIEFFHLPLARGDRQPRFNDRLVGQLGMVKFPETTRVIVGMAHDRQPRDVQAAGLRAIDRAVGRTVDVSATCGLGRLRHEPERVTANIRRTVELAQK
ncbi:MAG TPA: hypothetical protein VIP77_12385 [Jiangellaceae bacterium]